MRTLSIVVFLSLFFSSLLHTQKLARNPIMVINCETDDARIKFLQMITVCEDNSDCGEGFICVGNFYDGSYCYPVCDPDSEEGPPEGTICMEIFINEITTVYILVPDCSITIGECEYEYIDEDDVYWDPARRACGFETEGFSTCGCPEYFVPEDIDYEAIDDYINTNNGCIQTVPCYDGEIIVENREPNCDFESADENGMVTDSIIIRAGIAQIGQALSVQQLINCELTGDENFVLALADIFGEGVDAGWVFKEEEDDDMNVIGAIIVIEFQRDPFEETQIVLSPGVDGMERIITIQACVEISISDPCSCENPQNIRVPSATGSLALSLFHDILTVMAPTGSLVTLNMTNENFLNALGEEIDIDTVIPETPPGSGMFQLEFYRPPGTMFNISVLINEGNETQFMSDVACPEDCPLIQIPAIGTWALLIMSLLMLILAVAFIQQRRVVRL